jgi:hypothetical protein
MSGETFKHMSDTIQPELRKIDWSQFETAYGQAIKVPDQLQRLFSTNHGVAMQASHELWCGLCHQHAYVSSAAQPALPFILQALAIADNKLKVEILDILVGFAVCTARTDVEGWKQQLRKELATELPRFEALTRHPDEDVSGWAKDLCEELIRG